MPEDDDVREVPEVRYGARERHQRGGRRWPIVLSVATLGSLLVGMLVVMPLYGRPGYEVGLYDAHDVGATVSVRGQTVAVGATSYLPDARMVAVGRTDQGYLVYVDAHRGYGGGGGGAPERSSDLSGYDEIGVRTKQNTYKRVELEGSTPR